MSSAFGIELSTQVIWGDDQQKYIDKLVTENKWFIAEVSNRRTMYGTDKVTVLCRLMTMAEQILPNGAALITTKR